MPLPVNRHTFASAARASYNDEQLRQKRVAEQTYKKGSKVYGVPVLRLGASTQTDFVLQNMKDDPLAGKVRDRDKRGFETGARPDRGSGKYSQGRSDKDYDSDRYRGSSDPSRRASGSPLGILPKKHQKESLKKSKDNIKRDEQLKGADGMSGTQSSGGDKGKDLQDSKDVFRKDEQRKGAAGTSSEHSSSVAKVQTYYRYPIESDPYGYAVLTKSEEKHNRDNLDFYRNKIRSKPIPGHTIDDMLKWKGDYGMLERNHQYIQWLFPIPEGKGLNMHAQQLFEHEAMAIRDDDLAHKRVLSAYKMMLDFYGMQLVNSVSGALKRATKGWQERYDHLNRSRHNYYRITRILKSLGELGYERLQAPWVNFLIEEAVINGELPNLNGQCVMHWIMAVKDDGEREMLYRKASGLPIIQDNEMPAGDSESEGEDESETDKLKELDHHDTDIARVTLDEPRRQETAQKCERDNNVDTATAMLEQGMENVQTQESSKSVSVQKDKQQQNQESSTPMSEQNGKQQNRKHMKTKTEELAIELPKDTHHVKASSEPGQNLKQQKPIENDIKNKALTTLSTVTKDTEHMEASAGTLPKQEGEKHNESHIHNNSKTSSDEKLKSCSGELEHGMANLEITLPNANLEFYRNICLSRPAPGYTIVTMLRSKGKYEFFDGYPEFMQWLFPIPESTGRNPEAQPLYEHEAKAIREDDELSARVLEAFEVMLDYFGMCLVDGFKFKRNKKTYKKRYDNLQSYGVNYMRITRILTSLGELGYEHFQIPWIDFLITEGIDNNMFPTLDWKCISIWIGAIKDDVEKNVMFNRYRSLVGHKSSQICEDARMDVSDVGDTHYSGATADGNMNFLSFV